MNITAAEIDLAKNMQINRHERPLTSGQIC